MQITPTLPRGAKVLRETGSFVAFLECRTVRIRTKEKHASPRQRSFPLTQPKAAKAWAELAGLDDAAFNTACTFAGIGLFQK